MSTNTKKSIIHVDFIIWGDKLNPIKLTNILNIEPSEAFKKGDVKIGKKTGTKVIQKTGIWVLETEKYLDSTILTDHINFILNFLHGLKEPLHCLKEVDDLRIHLIIGVEDDESVEFNLEPDLLKEIVQQNIELSFSII